MSDDAVVRLNAALEGRYEIERELGEGGMATVYLARDVKHNRSVALKVLKPELAAVVGAERFLAEIETTANLQHPHILPLFDSGEADKFLFYVMPYVEGETLADRISRDKQLPVDEALGIATAVAGALQVAHDQGVIHRDIKPANILLSRGQPLVADFGIALAVGAAGGSRLTETGLSVGTPYYMSPEQATGDQGVGPASDTYALACVLYEMLVGEPPYLGNTAQAVLGKIIQGVPVSVSAVRKSVPANVDAAIRKGLEKLPADRFTGADAFARALADPGFRHGLVAGAGGAGGVGAWNGLSKGLAGLAAMLLLALGWAVLRPEAPAALQLTKRFEIDIGATTALVSTSHAYVALSPDGRQLVYTAFTGGRPAMLYIRGVDQLEARPLAGTENGYRPVFSPDGQWVLYQDPIGGQMKKVSIQGGQPLVLAESFVPMGAAWLEDRTIIYTGLGTANATGTGTALFRIPDSGGTPERLTTVDVEAGENFHGFPVMLPGNEVVVYTVMAAMGEGRIVALSLESGETRTLIEVGYDAKYSPSGHLVFARQGSLWAVPFDADRLEATGPEVVVLQDLEMVPVTVTYDFSPDGLLVYMPGVASSSGESPRSIVWVDGEGREQAVRTPARQYQDLRLSPDGTRVAVGVFDGRDWDLWVYDVVSGAGLRLTRQGGANQMAPIWTPDGQRIVYRAQATPLDGDLYWIAADGSGQPEPLVINEESNDYGTSISSDGRTLIYSALLAGGTVRREIWTVSLEGEHTPQRFLGGEFAYGNGSLSPDDRWLAYFSNESGDFEIYVQPYPGPGAKTPVSIGGGQELNWSPDGSELYYRNGTNIMVVDVGAGSTLRISEPRPLFPSDHYSVANGGTRQYHLAPDGRFLMIRTGVLESGENAEAYDHLVVVENWLDELRRLAPAN